MKDRIPTPGQEGRVQIEYEDGTKVIVKISMADNPTEQGTPFATATMLTDETAALYGKDGNAVPNEILNILSKAVLFKGGFSVDALGNLAGAQILTGSYVGTGTYGANNPNQLRFDFAPKLLWVVAKWDGLSYTSILHFADGESITLGEFLTTEYKSGAGLKSDVSTTSSYGKKSEDGKTIYWYNTNSADSQLNSASYNYYWVALC